ncbi:protein of unknown function [Kyrpidia spormannii]|uniref:Uncharacterized protein n=1 Tax=Kyrpidia spormannii TaxID=2055160 RepID=A0A6F9E3V1_9BACL|nr:protein of unknown function [Kyrpidia spormannii]
MPTSLRSLERGRWSPPWKTGTWLFLVAGEGTAGEVLAEDVENREPAVVDKPGSTLDRPGLRSLVCLHPVPVGPSLFRGYLPGGVRVSRNMANP